ncbi:hypothetical protein C8Q75DRAFT_808650 [Abortiporus biennis]|nr:hypothetical protein C8Q75DRAFT_808650 [Abortiporus biennis]
MAAPQFVRSPYCPFSNQFSTRWLNAPLETLDFRVFLHRPAERDQGAIEDVHRLVELIVALGISTWPTNPVKVKPGLEILSDRNRPPTPLERYKYAFVAKGSKLVKDAKPRRNAAPATDKLPHVNGTITVTFFGRRNPDDPEPCVTYKSSLDTIAAYVNNEACARRAAYLSTSFVYITKNDKFDRVAKDGIIPSSVHSMRRNRINFIRCRQVCATSFHYFDILDSNYQGLCNGAAVFVQDFGFKADVASLRSGTHDLLPSSSRYHNSNLNNRQVEQWNAEIKASLAFISQMSKS